MIYDSFQLTKNNHLRYWTGCNQSNIWRHHPYDASHMCITVLPFNPTITFVDLLQNTARELSAKHSEGINLFLSGGLDSEIACRCFLKTKSKFIPIVVKFTNDLNVEDYTQAINLCQELGIKPRIIVSDPIQFFNSGDWVSIGVRYQSYTFYQQLLLSIAEKMCAPMLTVDEIEISKINNKWNFIKKEDQDACWHRFIEKTSIPAYNNFYTYDPMTIAAFMQSPTVQKLIHNQIFGKLSWTSSKNEIYTELTNWSLKRRGKRHGMEKLMDIWHIVENEMAIQLSDNSVVYSIDALLWAKTNDAVNLQCHA